MKFLFFFVLIFFVTFNVSAQKNTPSSTAELAEFINSKNGDSLSKIRAAYVWVTSHMHYSTKNMLAINNSVDPRSVIDVAFQNRAGVCENFASIFTDLCQKMGFRAVVVNGFTTHNGVEDRSAHSWSAVNVNNDWYLFDPTWDMGKASGFRFFRSTGKEFIDTHIPFDPIWQLLKFPDSRTSGTGSFHANYRDSIDVFLASDSITLLQSAIGRIQSKGKINDKTDTHLKVLRMNLEIKYEEEQMQWYNLAVEKMNLATNLLNEFIDLRNENFIGVTNPQKLHQLLVEINENLEEIAPCLDKVDQSKAKLVYGTDQAREQLDRLRKKYERQQFFLHQYLTSRANDR